MFDQSFNHLLAVVICTGPSLLKQRDHILKLRAENKIRLYGVNNTFNDFPLDVWIACDPAWHDHYGKVKGDFEKWHWDLSICNRFGYKHIEGRWEDGLSTDPSYINYGHSSGYQALGLAYHYGHREIYLAGFDMSYSAGPRHYFDSLSGDCGEYPEALRKFSDMDKPRVPKGECKSYSLFQYYESVVEQNPCEIYNMTFDSAFKGFPFKWP